MKIAVLGAGAMGCLYGCYLSRKHDVILIDSYAPQVEAINDKGVTITETDGTEHHYAMKAALSGSRTEPVDLLVVFVKSTATYAAIETNQGLIGPDTLVIALSQSGETADTRAALTLAKSLGFKSTLAICNVANSSLVRESDMVLLTRAGSEIGVASTKAFTTQLLALLLITLRLGRDNGHISAGRGAKLVEAIRSLPSLTENALKSDPEILKIAPEFAGKEHTLFLGRGPMFPIALEGALKLKEISYIHAEGYASGELKHGPIALIDADMPVVVVAPDNEHLSKLLSNVEEVRARGGMLYIFASEGVVIPPSPSTRVITIQSGDPLLDPLLFTVALQLLAYHVAVINGTDVDQPRNLAKSVTVE